MRKLTLILVGIIVLFFLSIIIRVQYPEKNFIVLPDGQRINGPFVIVNRDIYLDGGSIVYDLADGVGSVHRFSNGCHNIGYNTIFYNERGPDGDKTGVKMGDQDVIKGIIYGAPSIKKRHIIEWINDQRLTRSFLAWAVDGLFFI